jgi:hypothetical protein
VPSFTLTDDFNFDGLEPGDLVRILGAAHLNPDLERRIDDAVKKIGLSWASGTSLHHNDLLIYLLKPKHLRS